MRILVVDDSPLTRKAMRRELERNEYEVEEARSGTEALGSIRNSPPDLIALDIALPDVSGFEVCSRLRSGEVLPGFEHIPVVFITADDTLEGRMKGFEAGASDFVTKKMGCAGVLVAVNRILRSNEPLRGTLAVVIEDSTIGRSLLRGHLVEQGVRVVEAKDGEEGLALIKARGREVDLVITDLRMPKITGDVVCARIRQDKELAHIPVIVITAIDEISSVLDVFAVGATDYLTKPYLKEELIARLNSHLKLGLLNRNLQGHIAELRQLVKLKDRFLQVCSDNLLPPVDDIAASLGELLQSAQLSAGDRTRLQEIEKRSQNVLALVHNLLGESQQRTQGGAATSATKP